MTTLLQLSDPHFGTERPPVVAALLELCRDLRPDALVLSGDITQRARRAQFAAARELVDRIGAPAVLAIAGNHDIPLFDLATRILAPYREHRRAFGAELEPELDLPDMLVVGVNTTRPYRRKDGEVSAEQIARVAQRLRTAPSSKLRIVVVHQPVAVPRASEEHNVLHGAEAAVRAWAAAGADVVLGGHIHLPYVLALHERMPELARRIWAVQAGTAVSARIRHEADNSVNVVRHRAGATIANPSATVERWDYREGRHRFELERADALELDR